MWHTFHALRKRSTVCPRPLPRSDSEGTVGQEAIGSERQNIHTAEVDTDNSHVQVALRRSTQRRSER